MICPNCGKVYPDTVKFCQLDGTSLVPGGNDVPPQQTPYQTAPNFQQPYNPQGYYPYGSAAPYPMTMAPKKAPYLLPGAKLTVILLSAASLLLVVVSLILSPYGFNFGYFLSQAPALFLGILLVLLCIWSDRIHPVVMAIPLMFSCLAGLWSILQMLVFSKVFSYLPTFQKIITIVMPFLTLGLVIIFCLSGTAKRPSMGLMLTAVILAGILAIRHLVGMAVSSSGFGPRMIVYTIISNLGSVLYYAVYIVLSIGYYQAKNKVLRGGYYR